MILLSEVSHFFPHPSSSCFSVLLLSGCGSTLPSYFHSVLHVVSAEFLKVLLLLERFK